MTAIELGYIFKEAPDLEEAGVTLARKLESLVASGPPTTHDALKDRLAVEELVRAIFKRYRERDFAFVGVA